MIKKNILITGASGMLGLNLCRFLKKKGFNVAGIYNSNLQILNGLAITKLKLDISSSEVFKGVIGELKKIDWVIHCAAMTNVDQCELENKKCFAVNVEGTKNIVGLAKRFSADLIYVSTPMVFSGLKGSYKETSKPQPINYYAKTKMLGEKEVLKYKNGLVIRVNPIGVRPPYAHPSFIQWFIERAKNNESFSLFSDVDINPISTESFSRVISKLLFNFKPGILHLGSNDIVNKAEVWNYIIKKFPNFSGQVIMISVDKSEAGKTAKRPKKMWLNVQKAISLNYKMPKWKKEVDIVLSELNL